METFELRERDFGYAVMNKTLDAYSITGYSIEGLKKYCNKDHVIIEWIPRKCGFNFELRFTGFDKRVNFNNGLWLFGFSIEFRWEYRHANGKVVYGDLR